MDNMTMLSYSKEWKEGSNMAGIFQKIVENCKVTFYTRRFSITSMLFYIISKTIFFPNIYLFTLHLHSEYLKHNLE